MEHFQWTEQGVWVQRTCETPEEALTLSTISVTLPLEEIYRRVFNP